jgi:hypothetical protein
VRAHWPKASVHRECHINTNDRKASAESDDGQLGTTAVPATDTFRADPETTTVVAVNIPPAAGVITGVSLIEAYPRRVEEFDVRGTALNSVRCPNPHALAEHRLDAAILPGRRGRTRGHGRILLRQRAGRVSRRRPATVRHRLPRTRLE